MSVEEMIDFRNYHFPTAGVMINSYKDYQWILKLLAKSL